MRALLTFWVLGSVTVVAGCSGAEVPPKTAYSDDGKPMTIVEFVDETSWPFEIADVTVALDGEALIDHHAPVGDNANWSFEVPFAALPHGDHTVQVRVAARYASTRMDASEGCEVHWRNTRTFVVGAHPVGVRIVAETDDVTSRFVDRLDVAIDVAGTNGAEGAFGGPPERKLVAKSAACRDDGPLPFGDHELANRQRFGPDLLR